MDRILVFIKATLRKLKEIKHPRAIISIKLGGAAVGEKFVTLSLLYISLYITIVFTSGVLLTALGVDGIEAFTGSAATMGNVGPGLGSVGSFGNFADLPDLGKWVLSFTMLLGRLEIYGLILCLMPGFWE